LNLVAAPQTLIINAHPVDVCTVQAAYVAHTPPFGTSAELSMPAAHRHVIEKHIGLWRTADTHDISGRWQREFGPLARTAVHHEEGTSGGDVRPPTRSDGRLGPTVRDSRQHTGVIGLRYRMTACGAEPVPRLKKLATQCALHGLGLTRS